MYSERPSRAGDILCCAFDNEFSVLRIKRRLRCFIRTLRPGKCSHPDKCSYELAKQIEPSRTALLLGI